ncbi:MAG: nucleotidyltransferase family protein [Acetobacteraceae bacterium]
MTTIPGLSAAELALVRDILRSRLPQGARAWVFGSRATTRPKPFSDLDLAIDAGRRLTLDEAAALTEAFSDSDLSWKTDIVDWQAAAEWFRAEIAPGMLPL